MLKRREHGEGGRTRRVIRLLDLQLSSDAPAEKLVTPIEWSMAGDVGESTVHAHRLIGKPQASRSFQWCWELKSHLSQTILDRAHWRSLSQDRAAYRRRPIGVETASRNVGERAWGISPTRRTPL